MISFVFGSTAVQPEILSVEADHLLVNRKLILGDG
jgi:hypothetical protein